MIEKINYHAFIAQSLHRIFKMDSFIYNSSYQIDY